MNEITMIDVRDIMAGNNDRTKFDGARLAELAGSIRENGLVQPVTVRPIGRAGVFGEAYQIVAGERRYRACGLAGLTEVPCIIRELDDEQAAALMLVENTGRADLDPVDEANAYAARIRDYGWTVADIATRAGVSPVRVQFRLKLLALRPDVQALVRSGQLTLGYAQILADGELDPNRQVQAVAALRDNPTPTPAWFRRIVGTLFEQQAQDGLFDLGDIMAAPVALPVKPAARDVPAHPSTDAPPAIVGTVAEVLAGHAAFWTRAAGEWADMGKNFKADACRAAADALRMAAGAVQ